MEQKLRIDPTSIQLQSLLAAVPKRTESAKFGVDVPAAKPATQPAVPNPVQSVQVLVALAAAANEPERRRALAEHAYEGLSELEKLHKELIAGVTSLARIHAMREWRRRRVCPDDPELARLMEEIELRILVEIAKQERG